MLPSVACNDIDVRGYVKFTTRLPAFYRGQRLDRRMLQNQAIVIAHALPTRVVFQNVSCGLQQLVVVNATTQLIEAHDSVRSIRTFVW